MCEFSGRSDELTLRDVCLDIELFLFCEGHSFPLGGFGRLVSLLFLGREELSPCELSHFGCDGGVSGDGCALVVNGSVWYGCAYGDGSVAGNVAYGAVEIVAGREERTVLGIGVVASCLLALSLWPGVETVVDVTAFSEVVLEVVGGFSSNLDWESSVNGFCYFSLLFLYFSFKIVNVHNTFEGFVWG